MLFILQFFGSLRQSFLKDLNRSYDCRKVHIKVFLIQDRDFPIFRLWLRDEHG